MRLIASEDLCEAQERRVCDEMGEEDEMREGWGGEVVVWVRGIAERAPGGAAIGRASWQGCSEWEGPGQDPALHRVDLNSGVVVKPRWSGVPGTSLLTAGGAACCG